MSAFSNLSLIYEPFLIIKKHRYLIYEMAKREIKDRYVGQVLSIFWSIGHPFVYMMVYIFIFVFVFKVKIGGTREMPLDYTTYLLSGLIPWMCFQETMTKGCTVIISNANLVKQVVFPIEILSIKTVLSSVLTMLISLTILICYVLFLHHSILWTYIFIPILLILQILAMIGVAYILSSISVYFRDIKDFIQIFTVVGVYLVPIFYLPKFVPNIFKPLLYLNPFSYMIWCYQDVLYFGRFEHWWAWIIYVFLSISVFYLGYDFFKKLKISFGNVL